MDDLGLDGKWGDGCATTEGDGVQWFSLELNATHTVTKVQIARRMDYVASQGRNVRITVGSSREYDPSEPLCLPEIAELELRKGLVNYKCTKEVEGKYVKLASSKEDHLTMCEVKVFIRARENEDREATIVGTASNQGQPFSNTHGGLIDGIDLEGIPTGGCSSRVRSTMFCWNHRYSIYVIRIELRPSKKK